MNAYLLSHNGLGDNLYMIGAVRFLLQYYENIYFLCKDIYYNNVTSFYKNNNNVVIQTASHNTCRKEIRESHGSG